MRQSGNETEEMFAGRVREQARLMVGVFDKPAIIAHFINGVKHNVMYLLQELLNQKPNMFYQAITTAAENYGDAHRGNRPKADRPAHRKSRTSASLLASDPTGKAPGYPFNELEVGPVFQAETFAAAQFSRTPSAQPVAVTSPGVGAPSPFRGRRLQSPSSGRDLRAEYRCHAYMQLCHFLYKCLGSPRRASYADS